jgi:hypothetical protein
MRQVCRRFSSDIATRQRPIALRGCLVQNVHTNDEAVDECETLLLVSAIVGEFGHEWLSNRIAATPSKWTRAKV